jgi:hypothetical protein
LNQLSVYDFAAGAGAGIYVVIGADLLDEDVDVFLRAGGGPSSTRPVRRRRP